MPQLDVFIFINSGIYLFVGFFMLLAYIHIYILPSLGSLIKLRKKLVVTQKTSQAINLPKINGMSIEKLVANNGSI